MDMKRILQALDNASTKPVEGADSMSKFLSIIDKNDVKVIREEVNNNKVLNEDVHKVSLPVQMAMQHYQKKETPVKKESVLKKYFEEVEFAEQEEQDKKRQIMHQYSRMIAERVISKK